MRAQLRLGLRVLAVLALGVGGLPVLLLTVPATRTLTVVGLPFPWVVLGVAAYPAAWLLARTYVRQAERIEAEFTDVVAPPAGESGGPGGPAAEAEPT